MHDLIKGSQLLSAGDLALIRNLIDAATADNTRRAYASDLSYFWAWAHLVAGQVQNYPVPVALVVRFILDHTGKMDTMPPEICGRSATRPARRSNICLMPSIRPGPPPCGSTEPKHWLPA